MTRLQWFLPRDPVANAVCIPVERGFSAPDGLFSEGTDILNLPYHDKARIRLTSTREALSSIQGARPYVLVWKLFDIRNLNLRAHLDRCFVIDPDWFSLVEALEWSLLYERAHRKEHAAGLQEISRKNLERLGEIAVRSGVVNVCGSGPSIQQLVDAPPQVAFNIICNTAVQSRRLVESLKPAAVAFANEVFFGPSEFARGIISNAEYCVRNYNAVIVTAGQYAQYLIATNYPHLRGHTLGLALGKELVIPSEERLEVNQSSNVATTLMLPLAAALRPLEIKVWGCDGGPPEERSRWSPWRYFAGGEPMRDSATLAHPAYFRDRVITESYYRRYYEHHCDYFETLLSYCEEKGLTITSCTPSHIPALQRRLAAPVNLSRKSTSG
jgi:hypothetical protein